jgi:hypothetical protein
MKLTGPFPSVLRLERTGPGLAVLRAPFAFISPTLGPIVVPEGFDTDYASVPRIFWSLYPPDGSYTEAAVIHDAVYFYQSLWLDQGGPGITRSVADTIFLEAMTALGVPLLRRRLLYTAVRAGGWLPWRRNARWHRDQAATAARMGELLDA